MGSYDYTTDIKQTSDGGYIITGSANSAADVDNIYGYVIWLLKTDSEGIVEFERIFQTDTAPNAGSHSKFASLKHKKRGFRVAASTPQPQRHMRLDGGLRHCALPSSRA